MSRKYRGQTQNLFLIETKPNESNTQKEYTIMGSTGNVYNVIIKNIPSCTCPDNKYRKKRCKHIYFVLIRIMDVDDEDKQFYTSNDLNCMFANIPEITQNLMVNNRLKEKYQNNDDSHGIVEQKPIDDLCPVCLDDLDNDIPLIFCQYSCGKSIHKQCFDMWIQHTRKKTCVFCRSAWDRNNNTKQANESNYINLIN